MADKMKLYTRTLFLLLMSACVSSCVNNYEYTGLKISQEDYNKISNSKMSKDELVEFVGSPTFSSDLGGDTWYYVYTITDRVAFFRPELVDEEVIAVKFKDDGSFSSIKKYTHEDINKFAFSQDSTPTLGTDTNPLQQIVKNIQKYSVPTFSKKRMPGS
jgi:outer membrane protein assembly factor BamE (lipoprotein component of BamABCDE complex)